MLANDFTWCADAGEVCHLMFFVRGGIDAMLESYTFIECSRTEIMDHTSRDVLFTGPYIAHYKQ